MRFTARSAAGSLCAAATAGTRSGASATSAGASVRRGARLTAGIPPCLRGWGVGGPDAGRSMPGPAGDPPAAAGRGPRATPPCSPRRCAGMAPVLRAPAGPPGACRTVAAVRRLALVIGIAVAAAAAVVAGGGEDAGGPGATSEAAVVRVVDGDTIAVRLGGRDERVRYIGVDTPESVKPGTPVQCFAHAAATENARLVAGERIKLVRDVEERDRFGRLLAYVYRLRDGQFVNAELVRRGYARPLTIPPNVRFADRFAGLARAARAAGRGLWSAC